MSVNAIRKQSTDEEVTSLAKSLIKSWKKLLGNYHVSILPLLKRVTVCFIICSFSGKIPNYCALLYWSQSQQAHHALCRVAVKNVLVLLKLLSIYSVGEVRFSKAQTNRAGATPMDVIDYENTSICLTCVKGLSDTMR